MSLIPNRIGFMILSRHDSVSPSFSQRGELNAISVQIEMGPRIAKNLVAENTTPEYFRP
jgi:hypothetical protein